MSIWPRWDTRRTTRPVSDRGPQRSPDGTAWAMHGPRGAPVVALIHGLGLCRAMWAAHLPVLAARHRVLSYDLHGHGDSMPSPRPPSLGVFADQLARLMDGLGIARAAVVGFSIGGMINRRFARDHGGRLSALAILNAPHDRGPEAQAAVEARAQAVGTDGPMATLEDALARWFTPAFRAARPEVIDQIRRWRARVDPASYAGAAWVLADGVRELVAEPPPIDVPTLVMTCAHDTGSTPAMSHAIAATIAGAEIAVVPDLRHLGLIEAPAAFTGPIGALLERSHA